MKKRDISEMGEEGFPDQYWDLNYDEPETMDCIGNVEEHMNYLKSLFDLELIEIKSLVDFGFGQGHMLRGALEAFRPRKSLGIEPSLRPFLEMEAWNKKSENQLTLKRVGVLTWLLKNKGKFDLGLCNSVFQYISTSNLKKVVPLMAKRVRYLYLTVPTDKELDNQVKEHRFTDSFALKRSRRTYQQILKKDFTFISSRLLESKSFFDEENTHFSNLLYRF